MEQYTKAELYDKVQELQHENEQIVLQILKHLSLIREILNKQLILNTNK